RRPPPGAGRDGARTGGHGRAPHAPRRSRRPRPSPARRAPHARADAGAVRGDPRRGVDGCGPAELVHRRHGGTARLVLHVASGRRVSTRTRSPRRERRGWRRWRGRTSIRCAAAWSRTDMHLSRPLEMSLSLALREARGRRHEFLTVEHVLYALLHDEAVAEV